ncbi:hypothetical protein WJ58_04670 [Burkholderia ubonensis]|nr:hypothetical protein WJ58_04670 [Burkholderia ubonensis]
MSGTVTVPQSCKMRPEVITIDFGKLSQGELTRIGQRPSRVASRTLQIQCNNISEQVAVNVSLEARPSSQQNNAIAVNNRDDMGIVVESANRIIPPVAPGGDLGAQNQIPVEFDPAAQRGQFRIDAYPVKLDNMLRGGKFNSQATLRVDFE